MEHSEKLRLSVSKLKTFMDCKLKYKYTYIDKLPRKEQTFFIFGKFCHSVLENFHNVYILGSNEPYNAVMSKIFKEVYEEYKSNMTSDMKKECWHIINAYLKIISTNKKSLLSGNVIAVEKEFDIPLSDNVSINGMIDRIQIDKEKGKEILHILDYKTTKNKKYLSNDVFQLLTYAYVMYCEDPDIQKIRTSYILLKHDFELFTKEFKVSDLIQVKDKFLDYADKILNEKNFDPTATGLCKYCDHIGVCKTGQEKLKKEDLNNFVSGEINW